MAAPKPIGNRIIEVPQRTGRSLEVTITHSGFVAYVPKGSVAKGEALVTKGGDAKTTPCVACHGETLKGVGAVPRIAGRSPLYIVRQLYNIQSGARSGTGVEPMKPVVANLKYDDMLSIAAYVASRTP